jgi:hypothetical protein
LEGGDDAVEPERDDPERGDERSLVVAQADPDEVGAADPVRYLDRLDGVDRLELEAMIDAYLARAPREAFDPERYASSGAPAVVDALERVFWGEAGMLPAVLPNLRKETQLTREYTSEAAGSQARRRGPRAKGR